VLIDHDQQRSKHDDQDRQADELEDRADDQAVQSLLHASSGRRSVHRPERIAK